ncbi:MAG: metal-dependent hydrolase [Nitrospiraceae bacterium]
MNPITHLLTGWLVANSAELNRRERTVVTLASVVPDIDGVGLVAELLTRDSEHPLRWWSDYHHVLGHNLTFGFLVAGTSFLLATKRWKTALLAFLSFHLHLVGDLIGGRGPEGYQWPIPYLFPFSNHWQWTWSGQWELNAWPNFLVTGLALLLTFYLAWKRGYSPLEMISGSADKAFVVTLRHRFSSPRYQG